MRKICVAIVCAVFAGALCCSSLCAGEVRQTGTEQTKTSTSKPAPATKQLPPTDDPYAPALTVVGRLKVSFGTAEKGDVKKVYFQIRNDGAGILKLHEPKTDCGCLKPKIFPRQLEKAQVAALEVTVVTSVIEGVAENKHVILYSNDPRYPNGLQLEVTGTVHSTINWRPPRVLFDAVRLGGTDTKRVLEVYDTRNIGLELKRVLTTSPMLKAEYEPTTVKDVPRRETNEETGEEEIKELSYPGYRIEVSLTEEAQVGRIAQLLMIETNYEPRKEMNIPIVGSIVGDFAYAPMGLVYLGGVRQGGRTSRRSLRVTALTDDFAVGRVVTNNEALKIKVSRSGRETRIMLYAEGTGELGNHVATLAVFREGQDDRPVITTGVKWRLRGGAITTPVDRTHTEEAGQAGK